MPALVTSDDRGLPDRPRSRPVRWPLRAGVARLEIALAVAFFAALCVVVLRTAPMLVEPDDYAYRGSVVAMTDGHFLTLSTAQIEVLAAKLGGAVGPGGRAAFRSHAQTAGLAGPAGPRGGPSAIPQWVHLADGQWISEKDPGYPFLAAAFQALGIIRWAPLFYGALACLALYFGARRWLGPFGGAAAVGLYCSSGTAILFAWREYMPTFIDASLIAAGIGALLWAVLAVEATVRRRTWAGLAGFVALEAATFTRYTDIVILACAVIAVIVAWRLPAAKLPRSAIMWWLGSAAVFLAGVGVFDTLVYGGPLRSGYRPGEVEFSLGAIVPNIENMPRALIWTTPMYVLGLAALAWITVRWLRRRRAADQRGFAARVDLAVALALGASWLAIWSLYFAYDWTAGPFAANFVVPVVRFYVPALGAISLLGAWLLMRVPDRRTLAAAAVVLVIAVLFGLGIRSFDIMTANVGHTLPFKSRPCIAREQPARPGHPVRCQVHGGSAIGPRKQHAGGLNGTESATAKETP